MDRTEKAQYALFLEELDGDEEKAAHFYIRWKCLTDLYFLGSEVMGWGKSTDKTGKRRRVDPVFHKWLAGVLEQPRNKLVLIQRGGLKTTWIKLLIVQRILQNPNTRIGLFSENPRVVKGSLKSIKAMLAALQPYFPDQIPVPGKDYKDWAKSTENELTVKRDETLGYVPEDMPQVTALGAGAEVTGLHIDELFADDPISKDTVTTPEQMQKSLEWWGYMQSVLEMGGLTTMTGTFYHYNDLYNTIIKEKHFFKKDIYIRPAVENGKIAYSTWFTHEMLARLKKVQGNYIFSCQYLLNPTPLEDQIFPPPQPTYTTLPADDYQYYIAVDPAATTAAWSDQTAIVVAAVNSGKQVFIVEAMGFKKPGNEIADILIKKCVQYKPVRVGIEFGLQEHLRHIIQARVADFEAASGERLGINIEPIPISRKMSKADRINLTLGSFIRLGKVKIHDSCTELIRQMDSFTGKGKESDDIVDGASMLFAIIDGFARNGWLTVRDPLDYYSMENFFKRERGKGWRGNFVA